MNMRNNSIKKKNNILYLHAGSEMYGADKILLEIVTNLDLNMYTPIVLLPSDGPLVHEMKKHNIEVKVINYPILRRKYFNIKGILNYIYEYFKYSKLVSQLVGEYDIKLLHVNTTAVLEGIYIKKKNKIPLVWHIHEMIVNPKVIYRLTSFLVNKYSTSVITVSKAVKNHLLNSKVVEAKKVEVIYNGISSLIPDTDNVDLIRKKLEIQETDLVVGMIGRVNAWKGQNDFIKAIEPLIKKYDHLKILLIGGTFEGEEWRMDKLMDRIESIEENKKIRVIDFKSNIADYHELIDIFVLPSTNPDPFPTVVLEAMSLGKPIVGYNHGGVREMIATPSRCLADPQDPTDLSCKIECFIKSSEARKNEGNLNKERQYTLFNKENYSEDIQKLYQFMLNK